MNYPNFGATFIPQATGPAIDPAEIPGGLELLFGEHADEVRAMLEKHKQRPPNRYVQIVRAPMSELSYRGVAGRVKEVISDHPDGTSTVKMELTAPSALVQNTLEEDMRQVLTEGKQSEVSFDNLVHLASIVARQHLREHVAEEREAIAQLVESATDAHDLHEIARRIRARKEQP